MASYYPNARKRCLIVKEQYYEQAKEIFKADNIMITTEGHRHLGAIIGTDEFKNSYIEKMIKDWIEEIQYLSEIAKTYPHSAYSAFVHGLQNRYTYTMRTIPDLSDHLQPLENAIRNCFIKTLFNGYICSDSERLLLSLPAKFGGLGIFVPTRSKIEYENSRHIITAEMIENVKNQISNFDTQIEIRQNTVMNRLKNEKTKRYEKTLADIKGQINDPVRLRALESCLEKGASSWLTALPLKDHGFLLDKQSFWDGLYLRYNLSIPRLPSKCVCGANFTIDHALSCPRGGFIIIRHNEVRDFTAELLSECCKDVRLEPILTKLTGERFPAATITSDEARVDIAARGFWVKGQMVYYDVRVFNPTAKSYLHQSLVSAHKSNEQLKKRSYNSR